MTARDAKGIKGADYHKCVIYTTTQAHHCIDKAINIAGMAEAKRTFIAVNEEYAMLTNELEDQIEKDKAAGLIPWLIVAASGTTDVGAIDPLEEIGKIANQHGIWYHIDGAYGAFFALTKSGKELLRGMNLSDSIVMDPHKSLFLP